MSKPSAPPTLMDVSRAAGVSTATISRCINDPGKVAIKTRERIEAAIDALGYTPNFGGRALASNRTNSIGAVIPSMENAMFASGLQAFQEVLSEAGKTMLVASTGYDPDREFHQIRALLAQGVDGLLLIGRDRPERTTDLLGIRSTPHVLAWCSPHEGGAPYVGFDNRQAAHELARQAIAMGHSQIAVIGGRSVGNDRARDRIAGFRDAVTGAQGAVLLQIIEADYELDAGGDALDRILNDSPRPTVVLCGNDVLATGAILRARDRGIPVPGALSITGFDEIALGRVVSPALTTIRVPQREMGRRAARLLMAQIAGQIAEPNQTLPTELVLRASLAPPAL